MKASREVRMTLIAAWIAAAVSIAAEPKPAPPLARVEGIELKGGAADLYSDMKYEISGVNYVYAAPTGARSTMKGTFDLAAVPAGAMFLHLRGRDDDSAEPCRIAIAVNGEPVFEGESEFTSDQWAWKAYPIPAGALVKGANEIAISNTEPEGAVGMPPWFMVAECLVGEKNVDRKAKSTMFKDFHVVLPAQKRPMPEPLAAGEKPGFPWRGTKGWLWKPEQYLAEIPILAEFKMNFLMNCYGSMCDIEHYGWGDPKCNRWWEPLPEGKRKAFETIVKECQKRNITFCFSMNPNLTSERIFDYSDPKDFDSLWPHYAWMQGLGVKWFNISLDDITKGIDAAGQAKMVNAMMKKLREADPEAQLIFCATHYWGTGENDPYLDTLAKDLHPDVYIFWTGDSVVGPISLEGAKAYRKAVNHRLFLWDNYPVNDATPTLHLGPVTHRDPNLCEVIDGYMGNPMHTQNEINRIPLLTCADYAYNPWAYDPARSIGQAILHVADTPSQQETLRDLVDLYPGFVLCQQANTGWNPVRVRFTEILRQTHPKTLAQAYLQYVESVSVRMAKEFPTRFTATQKTLRDDLDLMMKQYMERYGK